MSDVIFVSEMIKEEQACLLFYLVIVWDLSYQEELCNLEANYMMDFLFQALGKSGFVGVVGHKVATIEMKLRGAKRKVRC